MMRWLVGGAAFLFFGARPLAAEPVPSDALLEKGRAAYNFRCYYCHGYSGNARTLAATMLTPPPADFTRARPELLTRERIAEVLKLGKPGTAMKSFASVMPEGEIEAVAHFVHDEFVRRKAENTRYHTAENGWPEHDKYRIAYPFALGEIALTVPWEALTEAQAAGRRLYLESCVSCHDRGRESEDDTAWDTRPVSYPRNNYSFTDPPKADAIASASPYAKHDIKPRIVGLNRQEKKGETLFQANCAFCHGADGTGKNWIGQFLEPHPRNLRDPGFMQSKTREDLVEVIGEGLPATSMPAWKEVLSRQDIRAIVDYIAKVFHPLPPWKVGAGRTAVHR